MDVWCTIWELVVLSFSIKAHCPPRDVFAILIFKFHKLALWMIFRPISNLKSLYFNMGIIILVLIPRLPF